MIKISLVYTNNKIKPSPLANYLKSKNHDNTPDESSGSSKKKKKEKQNKKLLPEIMMGILNCIRKINNLVNSTIMHRRANHTV